MSIGAEARPNTLAQTDTQPGAPWTQVFAWSVRREIWENRSLWIAPLGATGFVLFGFGISLLRMSHTLQKIAKEPPGVQLAIRMAPYGISAAAVLVTAAIVALFYCLGTLYNERRDRSILFWKSMPVSDAMTVLSKAAIPLVFLPLVSFVVICATQLIMLPLHAAALAANGRNAGELWAQLPLFHLWFLTLYGIVTLVLWHAPIYGWLFVLSAWVRKNPFLWAVLPPLAIIVVEKLAFDTNWFADFMNYRLGGAVHIAFVSFPHHKGTNFRWPEPDPARFFSTPGLWLGLVAAAALFALAIWLRRRREPM